ncbi:5-formyltetrahydrofolate cyclo-ligase [Leptospira fletcheri]|uniref:5-formyltetrahydrofolate cyclo-ligase n=1 Tax=Leptospira fletcheri TaxID=2484981 RepID=A0A4R9GFW2_9LEPT|nr:5-formyltetrahydrofolate cyclo-ligase [Leptospira fletcheri]TGK10226.1 5-formyltetrahydrofolate cyclo-ligase [Leptospira fletcheri]
MESKRELRKKVKEALLSISLRKEKENRIQNALKEIIVASLRENSKPKIITYFPDRYEIPPFAEDFVIGEKIRCYYPKIIGTKLVFLKPDRIQSGAFGIFEPVGEEEILPDQADWILVPALGWNSEGARLGRGKGFYDRTLAEIPKSKLIGLTFESLFPCEFVAEEHDIRVGTLISEKKNHCFPKKSGENSVP